MSDDSRTPIVGDVVGQVRSAVGEIATQLQLDAAVDPILTTTDSLIASLPIVRDVVGAEPVQTATAPVNGFLGISSAPSDPADTAPISPPAATSSADARTTEQAVDARPLEMTAAVGAAEPRTFAAAVALPLLSDAGTPTTVEDVAVGEDGTRGPTPGGSGDRPAPAAPASPPSHAFSGGGSGAPAAAASSSGALPAIAAGPAIALANDLLPLSIVQEHDSTPD